jgi:PAS domain S-box-containing protein
MNLAELSEVRASGDPSSVESRVLILAPTGNDARLTAQFLREAAIEIEICANLSALCSEVERGCGALVIAEEALHDDQSGRLVDVLASQPAWSDIPIAIITSVGEVGQTRLRQLAPLGPSGNVSLLERPFRPETLVSTVEVALRARRRQHEVRGLLHSLQESEDRLRGILGSISDAFIALDKDWIITYVNPAYLKLVAPLYHSEEELVGHNVWERFPDIVGTDVAHFYERAMAEQKAGRLELFYEPLAAWLEVRASPSPQALSIYVQDISERKKHDAEVAALTQRVQEQARIFDTTLSNISDFAYTFDRQGRFIYVNKPLLDLWGLPLDQATGKNFFELNYPPDLAARLQAQLEQVFSTGKPLVDETPYTNSQGIGGYYEYIFSPVFGRDGEVEIVAGSTRDITERKRHEADLAEMAGRIEAQARLFDATLSHIADLAYTFDCDGRVIYANRPLLEIWGLSPEEVRGKSLEDLRYPPELAERLNEEFRQVIQTGKPVKGETAYAGSDGKSEDHEYIFNPVFDATGKVVAIAGTTRIITERKKVEVALQEAKDLAEAANRSKDHFLAVLSHELRTPLTPVLMVASSLEMDGRVPPSLRADMAMVRRNVELETKLIDDLLDLSRITTGKLILRVQSIDLNDAVRQVCEICQQQISEKGARLSLVLDESAPWVRADAARLQQMLWNILKNGVKFIEEGGDIVVSTRRIGECAEVAVRDSGIGIEPEMLPRIFDAFEQGGSKITRQFGGLGLGLAITKALAELHDGSIKAESEGLGAGSTFTICLPVAVAGADADQPAGAAPSMSGGIRILVVEDHEDTAAMLGRLLRGAGYSVSVANTAASAVAAAKQERFDLVLSDLGLPDATGYELIERLQELCEIKGIAMSGYGMEEDIRRSFEAGFSEHLVKPVDFSSLERAIRRLLAHG